MSATKEDIIQLLNQARVKLTGASENGLKLQLFDTLKEFFNDSSCWMENILITIAVNTTVYNIVANGGVIVRLVGVLDAQGFPQPAIMPSPGVIQFRHPYNSATVFTATVAKTVSTPTSTKDHLPDFPDWVLPLFGTGILDGLLGNMMNQPNTSYTDKKQSTYHLARFRDAISRARVAALRRNTFGTQAWSYPQSFATRSQRGGISVGSDQRFQ
jgi:hypothetical protein